ncbi:hypothetical protein AIOL_002571 [Candidatus Rhodobacter oscarellae]|uniref:Uncharacterized protein n=1 Tax=Candidatus Rhodobacter oscarellae TaxID=1675527 RepID=A0A0J9E4B5_9RHOB|nr:hypothetical protein AIOL_002571 [Candidatus Rhodobacter lobularis]
MRRRFYLEARSVCELVLRLFRGRVVVWSGHKKPAPGLTRGLPLEPSATRAAADLEVACASAQSLTSFPEIETFQIYARLQMRPPGGGRPQPRQAGRSLYVSPAASGVGKRCQGGALDAQRPLQAISANSHRLPKAPYGPSA